LKKRQLQMVRFVRLDLPHGYSNGYGYLFENDVAILKLMRLTQLVVVLRDHDADIVNSGGGGGGAQKNPPKVAEGRFFYENIILVRLEKDVEGS
jgi:hypothetical protein